MYVHEIEYELPEGDIINVCGTFYRGELEDWWTSNTHPNLETDTKERIVQALYDDYNGV